MGLFLLYKKIDNKRAIGITAYGSLHKLGSLYLAADLFD